MSSRYRCAACGNLTRFDVVASRTTRAFYHYTIAGELTVEEEEILHEEIEQVTCRWCSSSKSIEVVDEADVTEEIAAGSGPAAEPHAVEVS